MVSLFHWALVAQKPLVSLDTADNTFSVGFDLTPSHGVAAASYTNGSNIPLAYIEGDSNWRAMMAYLTSESDFPYCEPCVSAMTDMLRSLASVGKERLGQPILSASASMPAHNTAAHRYPPMDGLLRAAFAAAELEYIQIAQFSYSGEPVLFPENSVLAGHDLGLCHPYTSTPDCVRKDGNVTLPTEAYFYVGYYTNALEVSVTSQVVIAYGIVPYPYQDHHLGAEELERQSPDVYWGGVRRLLAMPLVQFAHRVPTKVIMYGDFGADEKMKATVQEVLHEYLADKMPEWVDDGVDPVYAGAFGAAEFAKRKPYWGLG